MESDETLTKAIMFLYAIGVILIAVGVYVGNKFDRLIGAGIVLVGGFMFILPMTRKRY